MTLCVNECPPQRPKGHSKRERQSHPHSHPHSHQHNNHPPPPSSSLPPAFHLKHQIHTNRVAQRITCGAGIFSSDFTRILLVKQREAQKWGFPKGSLEGEESLRSCMARELYEESGISLLGLNYADICMKKCKHNHIFFLRLCEPFEQLELQIRDKKEIEDIQWIMVSALKNNEFSLNHVTRTLIAQVFPQPNNQIKFQRQRRVKKLKTISSSLLPCT
jgi:8-oxo-dGTP pyrophosphatase MutT (NUDIX family)